MSNTANKVIQIALNEVGYLEKKSNSQLDDKTANAGSNNYTKYARDLDNITGFYNGKKNGYAWCDMFVDWCFVQAFGVAKAKELLNQPDKSAGAGCTYSAEYYRKIGQFFTSKPQVGDQIFFGTIGDFSHTGLVYKVDSKKVYTIEGNTSSAAGVVANGGCVAAKSYSLTYSKIGGYGRPKYDAEIYLTTAQAKVVEQMKSNSAQWHVLNNQGKTAELEKLVADTQKLGKSIGATYNTNGKWYMDGQELYSMTVKPVVQTPDPTPVVNPSKPQAAMYKSSKMSGTYKVTASALRLRLGAGTNFDILVDMPTGTKVTCYGYYNKDGQTIWPYVVCSLNGKSYTGYCSSQYLQKV